MLTTLGISLLVLLSIALARGRVLPMILFALLPLLAALASGQAVSSTASHISAGMARTVPVAMMFMFAITLAGVMRDAGVFQPLLRCLLRLTAEHPVRLANVTVLVGLVAHLDGAGPTTFLVAIPALMPLYDRLGMRREVLVMLLALSAGLMNLLPWGGPLARASAVSAVAVVDLWRQLLPLQMLGVPLLLAIAMHVGAKEQRRLASASTLPRTVPRCADVGQPIPAGDQRQRCNTGLCLATLTILAISPFQPAPVFMVALALALLLNHRGSEAQARALAKHAPQALAMAMVVIAAGSVLGVLEGTGMLRAVAASATHVLPDPLIQQLALLVALFAVPLHLLLSTDAYYFALLPLVMETAALHSLDPASTVRAMALTNTVGGYVGPFSPAVWLALGMTGVPLRTHLLQTLPWAWGVSITLLLAATLMGLV